MITLTPRRHASPALLIAAPVLSALVALLLATLILAVTGAPFLQAVGLLLAGAAGSLFALSETLARATPLIFTGLAAAIAFRARLWNIGAEGQLYAGALASVAIGTGALELPAPAMIPLILLAGFAAGALALLGPALARTLFGADEVVTTLLLNFVILLFVQMMLEGAMKDPLSLGWPQSAPIIAAGVLPQLIAGLRTHAGLLIALVAAALLQLLVSRTVFGFELRATGENAEAARYAGIPVTATLIKVAILSGGLAGLAGACEVAGLKGYLTADLSPGFGYSGIVVAMLAGLSPLAVVPAALFVAGIFVGADSMSRTLGISNYFADLVVALCLLGVLIGSLATRYEIAFRRKGAA